MNFFIFILLYVAHCRGQMHEGLDVEGSTRFPFVVRVLRVPLGDICTGSIIDNHWVITAAHCVRRDEPVGSGENTYTITPIEVIMGDIHHEHQHNDKSQHRSQIRVNETIHHQGYDQDKNKYDVALLWIQKALKFDYHINMVQVAPATTRWDPMDENVPTRNTWTGVRYTPTPVDEFVPPVGAKCKIIGAGARGVRFDGRKPIFDQMTRVLKYDRVRVVEQRKCSPNNEGNFQRSRNICVGQGENGGLIMGGDSGGPLVCKNPGESPMLYGVLFGYSKSVAELLNSQEKAMTYTRVTNPEVSQWINITMQSKENLNLEN